MNYPHGNIGTATSEEMKCKTMIISDVRYREMRTCISQWPDVTRLATLTTTHHEGAPMYSDSYLRLYYILVHNILTSVTCI